MTQKHQTWVQNDDKNIVNRQNYGLCECYGVINDEKYIMHWLSAKYDNTIDK